MLERMPEYSQPRYQPGSRKGVGKGNRNASKEEDEKLTARIMVNFTAAEADLLERAALTDGSLEDLPASKRRVAFIRAAAVRAAHKRKTRLGGLTPSRVRG